MRQDEIDIGVFPLSARDDEGRGGFESFVGDLDDGYAEEIVGVWSFGTGLGPVQEDSCSASVEFFPDRVKDAVS